MIRASLSLPVEKGAVPGLLRTRGISPTAQRVEIAGILLLLHGLGRYLADRHPVIEIRVGETGVGSR